MTKGHGLAHITLTVSDIEKTRKFYSELFQTEIAMDDENSFSLNELGAPVWFVQWNKEALDDRFDPTRIGLDHYAIKLETLDELEEMVNRLKKMKVKTAGLQRHAGKYPYIEFKDPDNIQTEFYIPKEL